MGEEKKNEEKEPLSERLRASSRVAFEKYHTAKGEGKGMPRPLSIDYWTYRQYKAFAGWVEEITTYKDGLTRLVRALRKRE